MNVLGGSSMIDLKGGSWMVDLKDVPHARACGARSHFGSRPTGSAPYPFGLVLTSGHFVLQLH